MKTKILQVLNTPPGEPFLREHAKAIHKHVINLELEWAFTMHHSFGLIKKPFVGAPSVYAFANYDRISVFDKFGFMLKSRQTDRKIAWKTFIIRQVKRIKPDIIHFHFATTAVKWSWIAEELQLPFTFSIRGSDINVMPLVKDSYLSDLESTARKALKIHVVNEELGDRFNNLIKGFDSKIKCIPTVVESKFFDVQNIPKKGFLLAVGRLHWIKGHRDLILACHLLQSKGIDFHLEIIGEGEERKVLEFMIRDLNLENKVNLSGNADQNRIMEKLAICDFFVQSSLDEGFPNSIAEAMAASVPVISTRCGGISRVLNIDNAFLSEPGVPEELAEKIGLALLEKVDRKTLVAQNKDIALRLFSEVAHCHAFSEFWKGNE